jgi:hypothetical protein
MAGIGKSAKAAVAKARGAVPTNAPSCATARRHCFGAVPIARPPPAHGIKGIILDEAHCATNKDIRLTTGTEARPSWWQTPLSTECPSGASLPAVRSWQKCHSPGQSRRGRARAVVQGRAPGGSGALLGSRRWATVRCSPFRVAGEGERPSTSCCCETPPIWRSSGTSERVGLRIMHLNTDPRGHIGVCSQ